MKKQRGRTMAKKPTIREVATIAKETMQRTEFLKTRMMQMEIVLSNYISLNKDEKKLGKFIEKRAKENAEARAGESVDNK
tara:strand:- start:491 stop:730 length:240 start_codon:yes stop_codon:yes gene_type:complete